MLGKLIKHEFKATYKIFGLLFSALNLLTLLTRFCVYIPFDNMIFKVLTTILSGVYVIAVVCMSLFSIAIVLIRFNRNMLRDQGYLSNTLPVKMWQQITAKVLTYTVWMITSVIMMFVSLFVFFIGKHTFTEFLNEFFDVAGDVFDYPKLVVIIVLFVILMIAQIAVNLLNVFAALSLGQIFAKHKIAGAILFYFVLNYALGFITSGAMMLMPNFVDKMNNIDVEINAAKTAGDVVNAIGNPALAYLGFLFVIELLLGAIYFVVTNFMLTKKLNLE